MANSVREIGNEIMYGFLSHAVLPSVRSRALRVAVLVGPVLAAISHGDTILGGQMTTDTTMKVLITFAVPYCVSTVSSVLAIRERSGG